MKMLNFIQGADPQMADAFRADGKIYVVVAVAFTVLLGLFSFLFYIERKLNKLEKKHQA